jgi:Pro-kumamolisin, activation domain
MSRSSIGRAAWRRVLLPALVALTVLSSSGFAATGSIRASVPTTASASTDGRHIRGATPEVVASGQAHLQARMDPRQLLRLTLVLQPRHQDELQRFLEQVLDPRSPRFHQFLTFDQWKARFAPTDGQVAAAAGWAHANGLASVHTFRNNLALKVEANAATVERAFDLQLNHYQLGNRRFFSNDRDPAIPQAMVGLLKDVQGLNSYFRVRPANGSLDTPEEPIYRPGPFLREELARRSAPTGGARERTVGLQPAICCGQGGGSIIEAPDLFSSEGYDLAGLQRFSHCCNPVQNPGGTPRETSIAIIGKNKIAASDLNTFAAQYGMAVNLTQVELNGPACCDAEMTLDIESATAFANSFGSYLDTAHVYAYEGGGTLASDNLDAWQAAHSADNARVASSSFGAYEDFYGGLFGPPSISDFSDVINAMTAEGWTIAVASGDHGATDDCQGRSVHFPASNPYVVAAGGTQLTLNNNAGKPQFAGEVAWNGPGCGGTDWPGQNLGGGGGGCADTEPAGFWQAIVTLPCGNKRALPDLSLNAGTGQEWYYAVRGGWTASGGGTSIVAPELAGFFAQLNSYLMILGHACGPTSDGACAPIGMPNAMIWLMGNAGSSANGHNPFYDITNGCNGGQGDTGYCAGPGYDLATGWGSVNMLQLGWALIDAVSHGVLPQITFSGPATNSWYNTDKLVLFSIVSPNPTGTTASVGLAGYTAQWDTVVADVKSHAQPGSGDSFYDGPQKTGDSDYLSLAAAGPGCHTAHVRAWDNAGETSSDETFGPVCYDNQPPTVICASPDGAWHATDASINCAAFDQPGLSGLANPADASFALTTGVPAGTETANALTNSHQVCDVAGNCATAGPVGPNKVDKKAPAISITAPTTTQYIVKQPVAANYACTDGGSGVATCAGPVASGSPIDTATVGTKTFTVNATDNVDNASSQSVSYAVTYRICLQYDPTKPASSRSYVFTLQLCDNNGVNVSQASIAVTATAVDGVAARAKPLGSLNPGNKFLYGPGTAPGASY